MALARERNASSMRNGAAVLPDGSCPGSGSKSRKTGIDRALAILSQSATRGSNPERISAISALGEVNSNKSREVLSACLRDFFARNRETAIAIVGYLQNPGCDFLYSDMGKCLAAIGKPARHSCIQCRHLLR